MTNEAILIGFIILGLTLSTFLAFLIVYLVRGRRVPLPPGHVYTASYQGFEATVILDDPQTVGTGDGLAEACAISMWATDYMLRKYGTLSKSLTEAVFVFYGSDRYNSLASKAGATPKSNGFAIQLHPRMGGGSSKYCSVIRSKFIGEVLRSGQLAVHEFLHCVLHNATNDWDHEHDLDPDVVPASMSDEIEPKIKQLVRDTLSTPTPTLVQ